MQHRPWSYYSGRLNFGFIDSHCCCPHLPLSSFPLFRCPYRVWDITEEWKNNAFRVSHIFMNQRNMALIGEADCIRIIWALSWISFWAGFQSLPLCLPIHLWRGDNYTCSSFASEGWYKDSFKKSVKVFEHERVIKKYIVVSVVLTNIWNHLIWITESDFSHQCREEYTFFTYSVCFFPRCICLRGESSENRSSATKVSFK